MRTVNNNCVLLQNVLKLSNENLELLAIKRDEDKESGAMTINVDEDNDYGLTWMNGD